MIRFAAATDLLAINQIYTQAIEAQATADITPIAMEAREAWFAAHPANQFPIYVFEQKGQVVAWLSISAYRPGRMALRHTAEISYYVDKAYFGKGIASQLLAHAIKASPSLHLDTLIAIILENNVASIAFLKKFGFAQWGHLPAVAVFGESRVGHVYYGLRI